MGVLHKRRGACGPLIISLTLPTVPGDRLLQGESFTLTGIHFVDDTSKVYWADGTNYVTATKTECTVVSGDDTSLVVTMCDPTDVGLTGYLFVVTTNGLVSVPSAVQTAYPLQLYRSMEEGSRFDELVTTGAANGGRASAVDYHADAAYGAGLGMRCVVHPAATTPNAYGKTTFAGNGLRAAFIRARVKVNVAGIATDTRLLNILQAMLGGGTSASAGLQLQVYLNGASLIWRSRCESYIGAGGLFSTTVISFVNDTAYLVELLRVPESSWGAGDGIMKVWIDGALLYSKTDCTGGYGAWLEVIRAGWINHTAWTPTDPTSHAYVDEAKVFGTVNVPVVPTITAQSISAPWDRCTVAENDVLTLDGTNFGTKNDFSKVYLCNTDNVADAGRVAATVGTTGGLAWGDSQVVCKLPALTTLTAGTLYLFVLNGVSNKSNAAGFATAQRPKITGNIADLYDGKTGIVEAGTCFGAPQGKVYLTNYADWGHAGEIKVEQTVTGWTTIAATFTCVQGGLSTDSTVYVWVVTAGELVSCNTDDVTLLPPIPP